MPAVPADHTAGESYQPVTPCPPVAKILVANRGEIAVRIIQTCREMGIGTVAVYSAADTNALHVQQADEAYLIGPPPALESYLNIRAILDAARASGADSVHPGYGFLAENADFARAVVSAGLTWIGPPADVIALMGDKVAAKELADSAGVPTVPGYMGEDQSLERFRAEAERIGYPVMIKAAAGGGGKGMRVVEEPERLEAALEGARREAHSAFGNDRVFLEKLLVNPRHIEIQVLLDPESRGVYLGERDCSIQRRHQKVIEEAPSPVMTCELRTAMGESALRLARAAGYVNAGTVEFLFAGDSFYFLEMNTRIQVEHPVTELVTGLDLVRLQIDIAGGRGLDLGQLDVEMRGHAIEARVYAEDPYSGFLPATGTLQVFRPPHGPGIRNDVGVFEGAEVGPYYDPILAKVTVSAGGRGEAVERLHRALERYDALGVTTNLGFLRWISRQGDFQAGRVDIGWVERSWPPAQGLDLSMEVLMAAAAFEITTDTASASGDATARSSNPWKQTSGWRLGGGARTFSYCYDGVERSVEAVREPDGAWIMAVDGTSRRLRLERGGPGIVVLREGTDVCSAAISWLTDGLAVSFRGSVYHLQRPGLRRSARASHGAHNSAGLSAPMPGTVVKVAVEPGRHVSAHEPLVILEAMKMEHVIEAPHEGYVEAVLYAEGDLVPAGAPVVRLREE